MASKAKAKREASEQRHRAIDFPCVAAPSASCGGAVFTYEGAHGMSDETYYMVQLARIKDACKCKACGCLSLSLVDEIPLKWNCDGCKNRWLVDSQEAVEQGRLLARKNIDHFNAAIEATSKANDLQRYHKRLVKITKDLRTAALHLRGEIVLNGGKVNASVFSAAFDADDAAQDILDELGECTNEEAQACERTS